MASATKPRRGDGCRTSVENVRGAFDLLEALAKIKLPSRSGN
jgi:hypothetical protein